MLVGAWTWLDGRMGPIAAYRGRWDAEATSRWHELGRPRLAFSPGDGQTTLDFLDDLDGLRHLSVIGRSRLVMTPLNVARRLSG